MGSKYDFSGGIKQVDLVYFQYTPQFFQFLPIVFDVWVMFDHIGNGFRPPQASLGKVFQGSFQFILIFFDQIIYLLKIIL